MEIAIRSMENIAETSFLSIMLSTREPHSFDELQTARLQRGCL